MTNLEKMKNFLCRQIRSMDIEQMENLTDLLEEWDDHGISLFDLDRLFSCKVCEDVFENAQMATGPVLDGFGSMRKWKEKNYEKNQARWNGRASALWGSCATF